MHYPASWRGLRPGLAALVFLVTLGALVGGRVLARNLQVDRPLARDLGAIRGVRGHKLLEETDGLTLRLRLDRVADLESVAERALAVVEKHEGRPVLRMEIEDVRRGLTGAYYELRFSLEEAVATGRYSMLRTELSVLAKRHGLDRARIYLDRRFIYVQLEKDGSYLYEALPRQDRTGPAAEGGI